MTAMPMSDGPSEGRSHMAENGAVLKDERFLLTLEEAARRLSVGRTTLYELARILEQRIEPYFRFPGGSS